MEGSQCCAYALPVLTIVRSHSCQCRQNSCETEAPGTRQRRSCAAARYHASHSPYVHYMHTYLKVKGRGVWAMPQQLIAQPLELIAQLQHFMSAADNRKHTSAELRMRTHAQLRPQGHTPHAASHATLPMHARVSSKRGRRAAQERGAGAATSMCTRCGALLDTMAYHPHHGWCWR